MLRDVFCKALCSACNIAAFALGVHRVVHSCLRRLMHPAPTSPPAVQLSVLRGHTLGQVVAPRRGGKREVELSQQRLCVSGNIAVPLIGSRPPMAPDSVEVRHSHRAPGQSVHSMQARPGCANLSVCVAKLCRLSKLELISKSSLLGCCCWLCRSHLVLPPGPLTRSSSSRRPLPGSSSSPARARLARRPPRVPLRQAGLRRGSRCCRGGTWRCLRCGSKWRTCWLRSGSGWCW